MHSNDTGGGGDFFGSSSSCFTDGGGGAGADLQVVHKYLESCPLKLFRYFDFSHLEQLINVDFSSSCVVGFFCSLTDEAETTSSASVLVKPDPFCLSVFSLIPFVFPLRGGS